MESWQVIVSSLGGSVALNVVLAFLFREWISTRIRESIKHEYTIKERRLEAELEGKLEGLKAGYQIAAQDRQVRFSKLHAEQAELIKDVYVFVSETLDFLTAMSLDRAEERKAIQKTNQLRRLLEHLVKFNRHQILLPGDIAQLTNNALKSLAEQIQNVDTKARFDIEDLNLECRKLLSELAREYRNLLGTTSFTDESPQTEQGSNSPIEIP